MMDFDQVERKVARLRQDLAAGRLTEEQFETRLHQLMVQDEQGAWWMVGHETGEWYRHDGGTWVRADPPRDEDDDDEIRRIKMKRPGGELASRPLHFIWIVDCSGSMLGSKIQALNYAIRNAISDMRKVADENPNAQLLVRALKFSDGALWHVSQPTPVEDFEWQDLTADGLTDMGKALSMVADQLKMPPMPKRALPPVLVLITDGHPTDDYKAGLDALMAQPWGQKAVRISIGIGEDANYDVLQEFIGHSERKPLQANNAESLGSYIRWVSTQVVKSASSPASQVHDAASPGDNVPIPAVANLGPSSADDVW